MEGFVNKILDKIDGFVFGVSRIWFIDEAYFHELLTGITGDLGVPKIHICFMHDQSTSQTYHLDCNFQQRHYLASFSKKS